MSGMPGPINVGNTLETRAGASNSPAGSNQWYGNLGGYTPLPYQAFGNVPSVNPQLIQGGDINSQLGPYANAVAQSMQPYFAQQADSLNQDLAQRGIFNSGAANASLGNLYAQQSADVLGQSLPYAQQNLQGNQNAINNAEQYNATAYGDVTSGNQGLYNNYLNQLFNANNNYASGLMGAYSGSFNQPGMTDLLGQQAAAGSNAYGNAIAGAGPLGTAFSNLFSTTPQSTYNPGYVPGATDNPTGITW